MNLQEYLKSTHNEYGVDRTLLIERLKLTPTERLREHKRFMEFVEKLEKAKPVETHDPVRGTPQNSHDE